VAGLALIAILLWVRFDPSVAMQLGEDSGPFHTGIYVMIGVAVLIAVVGFLGCCGAVRQSQCLLGTFFAFLLIILVIEIAVGTWSWENRGELIRLLREDTRRSVHNYGRASNSSDPFNFNRTATFDNIQRQFKCCGADSYADWASSFYNGVGGVVPLELGIGGVSPVYRLPDSCCVEPGSEQCQTYQRIDHDNPQDPKVAQNYIYLKGCFGELEAAVKEMSPYIYGGVLGVGIIQILGMTFSMILCCAMRKIDDYKA